MKLYAMSCGYMHCRKAAFVPSADNDFFIDSPMPVYLVTHPEGNVLFDTGPNPVVFTDAAGHWGGLAKAFVPLGGAEAAVVPMLAKIGVRPGDVRFVVNSHLHFDHAGGNRFFPDATFLVQARELECARDPAYAERGYIRSDWDDERLSYRAIVGELDLFGDGRLILIPLGGHTLGHQVMLVRLEKQGVLILSGDAVPCRENYTEETVTRTNMDNEGALASIRRLRALVERERALLIHGHDPWQWEQIIQAPAWYE